MNYAGDKYIYHQSVDVPASQLLLATAIGYMVDKVNQLKTPLARPEKTVPVGLID